MHTAGLGIPAARPVATVAYSQTIMRIIANRGASAGTETAKGALFDALAEVAGALASGRRLEIVDLLAQGERSVEEVARELGQSLANTSHHLRVLARAGLVRTRREGTRIHYRLAGPGVEELWSALRAVAAAERDDLGRLTRAYLGPLEDVEVVDRDELLRRLLRGDVVVLDVRPVREYQAGHIPGARSVPLEELASAIEELPADVEVVAYCRGPYCVFAPAAVRALRRAGYSARRLEDGFPEWRRAGFPVAVGEKRGRVSLDRGRP
ncbi:ArsR/SmtB family transcription factor [Aciditerrimonas ferrireducens]|uniref:ArsR/SmtB family transcription factor n=1 Tax=Aciditerrimonas ferrireducens TaxID=667306 RepID=UPI0020050CF7|nr:metalloregulator ArsR/SmtB family transcription factor [Aciditerrimonas ferrireducens]MCK4178065.1 metalloregulator ArsR/SmtB family transcription factor [Aciditerrimonas ferrireducens]